VTPHGLSEHGGRKGQAKGRVSSAVPLRRAVSFVHMVSKVRVVSYGLLNKQPTFPFGNGFTVLTALAVLSGRAARLSMIFRHRDTTPSKSPCISWSRARPSSWWAGANCSWTGPNGMSSEKIITWR
jgi:hypothetical protein